MMCGAVLAGALLVGCSPEANGVIGIARDVQGNLVAVIDPCGDELDYVTLTRTRDGGPTATVSNGRLLYDTAELGRSRIAGESPQLVVVGQVSALEAGFRYTVGAWDDDQSVSTGTLDFDVDDVTSRGVGEVDQQQRSNAGAPTERTVEQWLATPCSEKRN